MKILILGFTKIKFMPYLKFYIDSLLENNELELVYWNRDGKEDIKTDNKIVLHEFGYIQKDEVKKIKKLKAFYKYRKYVKKIIKNEDFDRIIVLHTLPGILLLDILIKKYSNKYILDYRDFTYENVKIYKKMIEKLVINAKLTLVSSEAYRKYLPKLDNIYTIHNVLLEPIDYKVNENNENTKRHIVIRFWGFIRHEKINKEIIKKISQDNRFELHYHGREQQTANNLKEFCKEIKAKNIFFHGEYMPDERYKFARDTDLLHNIYENDTATVLAMGNKYYDGLIFNIPQICNKNSFMGKCVTKNEIGIELDPYDDDFLNDLYKYYSSIDRSKIKEKSEKELERILAQNKQTKENVIKEF